MTVTVGAIVAPGMAHGSAETAGGVAAPLGLEDREPVGLTVIVTSRPPGSAPAFDAWCKSWQGRSHVPGLSALNTASKVSLGTMSRVLIRDGCDCIQAGSDSTLGARIVPVEP